MRLHCIPVLALLALFNSGYTTRESSYDDVGRWALRDQHDYSEWLVDVTRRTENSSQQLHPTVREFGDLIESRPHLRMLFALMFQEVPRSPRYVYDLSGRPQIRDYRHMLRVLDHPIQTAPAYSTRKSRMSYAGIPLSSLLNWPMGTQSGFITWPQGLTTLPSNTNWTWFELHLNNDPGEQSEKLSIWIYDSEDSERHRFATVRKVPGVNTVLPVTEFAPSDRTWTSTTSNATYPLDWVVTMSDGTSLSISSVREDQELCDDEGVVPTYEGYITVNGFDGAGDNISGFGVVEVVPAIAA